MAKSYSLDLREKAAAFVERGNSRREASRVFGVSPSFTVKLMERRRQKGTLAAEPRGGRRGKLAPHKDFLLATVEADPDQTMPELAANLSAARDVAAAPATLSRFLIRCGLTRKKRRWLLQNRSARMSPRSASSGSRIVSRACALRQGG